MQISRTFYSMANIVAACIDSPVRCDDLFDAATPIDGPAPTTVLQALANMTKYPSGRTISDADGLFDLSLTDPVYGPALRSSPSSWLLFIKFTGAIGSHAGAYNSDNLMSGPGQIGFDKRGFAWINDNYRPSDFDPAFPEDFNPDPPTPESNRIGCAGLRLLKFYPSGNTGGLTIPWGDFVDGNDTVWVFNFGVDPNDSSSQITALSQFCGAGKCPAHLRLGDAISPPTGYLSDALDRVTGGGVDRSGNIWILNNWKKLAPLKVGGDNPPPYPSDYPVFERNPGGNSFVIVPGAAAPIKTPLLGPPESFYGKEYRPPIYSRIGKFPPHR